MSPWECGGRPRGFPPAPARAWFICSKKLWLMPAVRLVAYGTWRNGRERSSGARAEVGSERGEVRRAEAVGGGVELMPVRVDQGRRADLVERVAFVGGQG